jgi:hypothetical protein
VVFLGLLVLSAHTGPDRYSVDYYLEQCVPWWWRLAEMRRPESLVLDLRAGEEAERPIADARRSRARADRG